MKKLNLLLVLSARLGGPLAAAELAASLNPEAIPELKQFPTHTDSGVRHWAAAGLLMRGPAAVSTAKTELSTALNDASPSVRVAAAEALESMATRPSFSVL